ncbi:DUF262 domain-containing protein [Pseudomonas sp. SXM-1]|uniref:DUF262 domain-containing protein n=1 Tax=Pseudomonas sp. SXM-1 TaxID=2169583 RepID=UPI0010563DA4|nr:DUF262 domain-containing protein [Pseudomonas sp. SXM-1]QBQ10271.1 DUF262 domain-containing protein [Pseudomonas sp. SXM-1]
MNIKPSHVDIGVLFGEKTIFTVPKYQRGYAWDDESVADFISDVSVCYSRRVNNNCMEHFLGGVLSIKSDIDGVANAVRYQLVDGQQRITTLTLLAFVLCENLEELAALVEDDDKDIVLRIEHHLLRLRKAFIVHDQVVNRIVTPANVLTLSKKDEAHFRALLAGRDPIAVIDSHVKLSASLMQLKKYISSVVVEVDDLSNKLDVLERFQDVLLIDFSVLHMVAENKPDAYRLFQVINDRGVSLTDGDLLRVKTLELLEGHGVEQDAAELIWDDILSDKPSRTYDYLQWIYESYAFKRARSGALADVYMEQFFGRINHELVNKKDARFILSQLEKIRSDVCTCRSIIKGEWVFDDQRPVTPWDRTRLRSLIVDLGHTLCVPLLLAISDSGHVKFRDVVLMLERSFYRYKIICNEHVTPLKSLYYAESQIIRADTKSYKVQSLRDKLNDLLAQRAPMANFINGLLGLHYQAKTGGNKNIKHLLMMLDSYGGWYCNGANGNPACLEGNRILDFGETSIEHIYPRNAKAADIDPEMEERKNSIGNLTLLDPEINSSADNKPFNDKRDIFKKSSIALNVKIGAKRVWNVKSSTNYERDLLAMAKLIFVA